MVAQKSGTNRVILNTGWTALKGMLEYKAANVIVVPAMNTSRKCHECGAVEAANRRTRDDFICLACGHAAPCRSQRGEEHPRQGAGAPCRDERGVRGWRVCTASGVCAGNL